VIPSLARPASQREGWEGLIFQPSSLVGINYLLIQPIIPLFGKEGQGEIL
jgi:hypothetical protein